MDANQVIQVGPIQFPLNLVLLVLGIVIATIINERIARKRGWDKEQWSDLIILLVLVFVIIYKFGWAIFDIKRVIANPSSLIWISGSNKTVWMASIVSLFVLFYKTWKKKYPVTDLLDFGWVSLSLTLFIYHLFIMDYGKQTTFFLGVKFDGQSTFYYHPINWYRALIIGLLLFYRVKLGTNIGRTKLLLLYLFLGLGLLIITMADIPLKLYFGLTSEQLGYLFIAIVGVIGLIWNK